MSIVRPSDLEFIKRSGLIAASALKKALQSVKAGVSELEIDQIAQKEIYNLGGDLSYKTVPGYRWATCITVNDEVVHGIPTQNRLKEGDLVSVDLAVMYKGWHTDTAWTILIGEDGEKLAFLKTGKEALKKGIKEAVVGKRVGDISYAVGSTVEGVGYSVVRSLVGHGVGRQLHEYPEIPGYGRKGTGEVLREGMSLAIEVIYTKGKSEVILDEDGWTYRSADGSLAGLFESTVIVGKKEARVLTDWRKVG